MALPTYEVLESVGNVHKLHLVTSNGYDEVQEYFAEPADMTNVFEVATATFEATAGTQLPRLNTLVLANVENQNEVDPVTVQVGAEIAPLI